MYCRKYILIIFVCIIHRQEALLSDEQAQEIVAMLSPHAAAAPHATALAPDNGVSLNDSYQSVLSYERWVTRNTVSFEMF